MGRCQNGIVSQREKECIDDRQCDTEELVKDRKERKMCQRGMVECKYDRFAPTSSGLR